jgi:hypothetical protein
MPPAKRDLTDRTLHFYDFDPNTDSSEPSNEHFKAIATLGQKKWKEYQVSVDLESREKPWRAAVFQRAHRISVMAQRCRETHQNEEEWRAKIEHDVVERFDREVVWFEMPPRCFNI